MTTTTTTVVAKPFNPNDSVAAPSSGFYLVIGIAVGYVALYRLVGRCRRRSLAYRAHRAHRQENTR